MKIWCVIGLVLLIIGCRTRQDEQGLYLDLSRQLYGKESTFNLSEISDSISYIPLETHPDALLKGLAVDIKFAGNYIFIVDNNILYRFNTTGKYLNKLANHGRGPFEFIQIEGFDINMKTDELYVYDNVLGKIDVFDTALNPLRTLRSVPHNITDILIDKNNNIVCSIIRNDFRVQGKIQNSLVVLSSDDGHEIFSRKSHIPSMKPKENRNFVFSASIRKYNDHIYYKEHHSDTYYSLQDTSSQDSIVYRIHVGLTYPAELDYNWARHDEIDNYPRLGEANETLRYIFIHFRPKNENPRLACYDKGKQKLTVFPEKKFPVNDFDQGCSPKCFRKIDDLTLVEIIPAMKFKDLYEDDERFNISEEDNPVLMLIHLKK